MSTYMQRCMGSMLLDHPSTYSQSMDNPLLLTLLTQVCWGISCTCSSSSKLKHEASCNRQGVL